MVVPFFFRPKLVYKTCNIHQHIISQYIAFKRIYLNILFVQYILLMNVHIKSLSCLLTFRLYRKVSVGANQHKTRLIFVHTQFASTRVSSFIQLERTTRHISESHCCIHIFQTPYEAQFIDFFSLKNAFSSKAVRISSFISLTFA